MMEKGCPNCGRMIDAKASECPYCKYNFGEINQIFEKYAEEKKVHVPKYAGFIKRTAATGFDHLLLTLIFIIINIIYIRFFFINNLDNITKYLPWILYPIIYLFYCTFRQSSRKMGTIGEKLVGIEVVDEDGNPVELGIAFKRNLARILNVLTLGVGYLLMIFHKNKQALSDIVTHTYVTNRITGEDYNKHRYGNLVARTIAYIIDMAFLWLLYWILQLSLSSINATLVELENTTIVKIISIISLVITIIVFLVILFYFPYMESKKGGTIGKLVMGLRIVNLNGERIGFFKSLSRLICAVVEFSVPLGLLLAFVTPRKQTLKDLMTKTIVVDRH